MTKEKEKKWETIESKKKIPMFSAYRNNEEYAEAFKDVSDSMKRGTQYKLTTLTMRLQQTIIEEMQNDKV